MNGSTITLKARDGGSFAAYLAVPATPKGGAVVVLQEIFGVNANIRAIVDDFAGHGYIAIAPDLFWRQQPGVELDPASDEDREKATGFLKGLDQKLAVEDALVALDHARERPGANGKGGAVGYCLGGKLAYLLATCPGVDAAVSYYGVAIQTALDRAADIRGKLLLHIAADDHLCPPEAQAAITDAMRRYPDRVQVIIHPGVGHAFARRGGAGFNAEAAARADAATQALLASELGA